MSKEWSGNNWMDFEDQQRERMEKLRIKQELIEENNEE